LNLRYKRKNKNLAAAESPQAVASSTQSKQHRYVCDECVHCVMCSRYL